MERSASLKRIEELLSALVRMKMSEALKNSLRDKKYRMLYELTGKLPVKRLSEKTGFSVGKISGIWQSWEAAGLVIRDGKQYRRTL